MEIAKRIEQGEMEILETVASNAICIRELITLGERLESGDVKLRESLYDTEETLEEGDGEESENGTDVEDNGENQDEITSEELAEANRESLLEREAENLKEALKVIKRIERRVHRIEQLKKEAVKASRKKAEQL